MDPDNIKLPALRLISAQGRASLSSRLRSLCFLPELLLAGFNVRVHVLQRPWTATTDNRPLVGIAAHLIEGFTLGAALLGAGRGSILWVESVETLAKSQLRILEIFSRFRYLILDIGFANSDWVRKNRKLLGRAVGVLVGSRQGRSQAAPYCSWVKICPMTSHESLSVPRNHTGKDLLAIGSLDGKPDSETQDAILSAIREVNNDAPISFECPESADVSRFGRQGSEPLEYKQRRILETADVGVVVPDLDGSDPAWIYQAIHFLEHGIPVVALSPDRDCKSAQEKAWCFDEENLCADWGTALEEMATSSSAHSGQAENPMLSVVSSESDEAFHSESLKEICGALNARRDQKLWSLTIPVTALRRIKRSYQERTPLERIPVWARPVAVSIAGVRNYRRRYGKEYRYWTALLAKTGDFTESQIEAWQKKRLLRLLQDARTGSPHYSKVLPVELERGDERSLHDILMQLPILEKDTIRQNLDQVLNRNRRRIETSATSGSTGTPMRIEHDIFSIQRRFAFLSEHLAWFGIQNRDPSVRLSGRILVSVDSESKRPWLFNRAENQLFLSTYHLDSKHGKRVAEKLASFEPKLIDGYPSGILEALRCVDAQGCRLSSLKAIITTAETLSENMRSEIEALSGVPVADYYSASEGVPLIQQCAAGTYHVRWQSGIFEVSSEDGISDEGDGELVCTSFVQERTPLIRYRTGDIVKGLRQRDMIRCSCGLRTPTVEHMLGRVEDLIVTRDGRKIGMFTYRTLKLVDGLLEAQVIQRDYSDFAVNAQVRSDADAARIESQIKGSFERALGYEIDLEFSIVSEIPKGANGKIRLVISRVGK